MSTAMDEAEFDRFADEYRTLHARNIRLSGETPEYFAEYKVADVARELRRTGTGSHPLDVLDFGAGIGTSVAAFGRHLPGCHLTCLDVSRRSLEIGRERHGEAAALVQFDGRTIPFPAGCFDVGFVSCVFHHVDGATHVPLLREIRRVLRQGAVLAVFEHNPYNPLTRRAVASCPFDDNAVLIRPGTMRRRIEDAGFRDVRLAFRCFVPGWLRPLRPIERVLAWLPLGAQYAITARA